ncbi:MAG: peptidase T, partial [Candidatus Spyradocola sp.]
MESIVERFLRYVSYDTQSSEESDTFPSTLKQKELGKLLAKELYDMGAEDAHMDEWGYVYATIPGNAPQAPTIGFIAHMDTATELTGAGVKPRIVHYEGGDIVLNEEKGIVMRADEFECLQNEIGKDLIVTDGTTLLGADDKAGVAEIMEMAEHFLSNPAIPHGTIRIAFTPDEEVGGGPEHFDVPAFHADFAYTIDGGEVGSLNYENFNAASATVDVRGKAIHPGSAKGKMINASLVAMEFDAMLPVGEVPALTEGYEGFHHLTDMQGSVEGARLHYILRDHDRAKIEEK